MLKNKSADLEEISNSTEQEKWHEDARKKAFLISNGWEEVIDPESNTIRWRKKYGNPLKTTTFINAYKIVSRINMEKKIKVIKLVDRRRS